MRQQSKHAEPTVKVFCLAGFIARPGYAAKPGELVDVTQRTADAVIAMGKARLHVPEDPSGADEPAPRRSKSRPIQE